jgi:2'-5' RNA ligase
MYAIVLMLPDEVERELERLRGEFASHVAYVPFAHITVVYPFSTADSSLVADRLVSIAAHTRPFPVVLDGIGYFENPERVAYLMVKKVHAIRALRKDIKVVLAGAVKEGDEGELEFHPHVTIGASIPEDLFPVLKQQLSNYQPHFELEIRTLSLFSNETGGVWTVERIFTLDRR